MQTWSECVCVRRNMKSECSCSGVVSGRRPPRAQSFSPFIISNEAKPFLRPGRQKHLPQLGRTLRPYRVLHPSRTPHLPPEPHGKSALYSMHWMWANICGLHKHSFLVKTKQPHDTKLILRVLWPLFHQVTSVFARQTRVRQNNKTLVSQQLIIYKTTENHVTTIM